MTRVDLKDDAEEAGLIPWPSKGSDDVDSVAPKDVVNEGSLCAAPRRFLTAIDERCAYAAGVSYAAEDDVPGKGWRSACMPCDGGGYDGGGYDGGAYDG